MQKENGICRRAAVDSPLNSSQMIFASSLHHKVMGSSLKDRAAKLFYVTIGYTFEKLIVCFSSRKLFRNGSIWFFMIIGNGSIQFYDSRERFNSIL
jgi:hypothetical protein